MLEQLLPYCDLSKQEVNLLRKSLDIMRVSLRSGDTGMEGGVCFSLVYIAVSCYHVTDLQSHSYSSGTCYSCIKETWLRKSTVTWLERSSRTSNASLQEALGE